MYPNKWIQKNTASLLGKTVAITGSTGGLGKEICRILARLDANLILVDRNRERSEALKNELLSLGKKGEIYCITADLEDFDSVKNATDKLSEFPIDYFLHNAGAYKIPRKTCDTGFDNVFQINFVSPYYMIRRLLPILQERGGRVITVSSIALGYSKTDESDIDFKTRTASSLLYGNAKRFLTFSLYGFFENEDKTTLSIVHPGIALTNITAHYPKVIFALIKFPMKIIFMHPRKACLSVIRGFFEPCDKNEWIGPRIFDIWGPPKKKKLHTCGEKEAQFIFRTAEEIYLLLCRKENCKNC